MLNEVGIIVTVYAVKTNSHYITSGRLKRKSVSKKDIERIKFIDSCDFSISVDKENKTIHVNKQ